MCPFVWTYPGAPYLLNKLTFVERHQENYLTDLQIFPAPRMNFNFVYCDVLNAKTELPWNVETLLFAFSSSVWSVILASMIIMVITLKFIVQKATLYDASFAVVGSTFPENISASTKFNKTPLFYVWILSCSVVSIYYSATITSNVISPSEVSTFSYFAEVVKNNFTLLFEGMNQFNLVKATISFQMFLLLIKRLIILIKDYVFYETKFISATNPRPNF